MEHAFMEREELFMRIETSWTSRAVVYPFSEPAKVRIYEDLSVDFRQFTSVSP